ncbi:MAG TPA: Ig-like domain-containing protein [Cyclobacteriaceae bacterium]|nr:Ig-like domain-containing protein [Cyclobacteriaceae bacterium]
MKHKWIFILLATSLLVQQCAKQTAPTGGPKDTIAPQLESSNPEKNGVNFKSDEIQLTFDEPVQLNNPREQLIITPGVGKKFELTTRKNKVILKLNATLQENTTYNINFRESIQDLTEKNPAKVKLAFSTGSYIDSLSITGHVTDVLTDQKLKNYTVAMVQAIDTFNIFKHPASWISITDDAGKFSIENLKPGDYFLYAFEDRNKNLIVDSKTEKYGFKNDNITLTKKTDSVKLSVFKLDASNLKLLSARPTFAYFNIRTSKSLVDYKLSPESNSEKILSVQESDLSTIKVYNTIPGLDSLQARLQASDSIGNKIDTLLYIKFAKKESTKDKFSVNIESPTLNEHKSLLTATVHYSKPVIDFNTDSIYIQVDSVNRITFSKNDFTWNTQLTKLSIRKKLDAISKPPVAQPTQKSGGRMLQEKKNENFVLTKGSALSVEGDTIIRASTPVKKIIAEELASVSVKIQTKENFILQLLDKNYKLIEESANIKNHIFENITPGTYFMRIIIDVNKNGKWDAGNYKNRTQPEPIVYYTNPKGGKDIYLKANWQVGDLLISY